MRVMTPSLVLGAMTFCVAALETIASLGEAVSTLYMQGTGTIFCLVQQEMISCTVTLEPTCLKVMLEPTSSLVDMGTTLYEEGVETICSTADRTGTLYAVAVGMTD